MKSNKLNQKQIDSIQNQISLLIDDLNELTYCTAESATSRMVELCYSIPRYARTIEQSVNLALQNKELQ